VVMVTENRVFGSKLILLTVVLLTSAQCFADATLHQQWDALLQRHVNQGEVNYLGFKKDQVLLQNYLDTLNETDPETLSPVEQLAFYINAYNAYTVWLILEHFEEGKPPVSIKKIGGFFTSPWKISFVKIGGQTYSLDDVEHGLIRKQFAEPRIHFAVNCASKSCPPLMANAYLGDQLDSQLERSTQLFLADRKNNYLDGTTLHVSSIFKWYAEDFNNDPVSFFIAHTQGELRVQLIERKSDISVEYLTYDWSLNGPQN